MRKYTILMSVFCVMSMLVSACGPGQMFGPTLTPTSTHTVPPTSTYTPTATSTATKTSTLTPTKLPGLGVTAQEIVDTFEDLFQFHTIADVEGQPAQQGVSENGYSTITLIGEPYVSKAELRIDLAHENSFMATGYWILFLEITSHGGKEAADWVHDNYAEAVKTGKEETEFGKAKVILEAQGSGGKIFVLTVEPVE